MRSLHQKTAVVCCCATTLALHLNEAAAKEVKEPHTGVAFPADRRWGSYQMTAVGVAYRRKFLFDVFAACFYVDKRLGRQQLGAFLKSRRVRDVSRLKTDERFFSWLIRSDLPMMIDVSFVRSAPLSKMREQYKKMLDRTLKDTAVRDRFLALPTTDIQKYKHMIITFLPGGRVVLSHMGKTHAPIISKPLARALLSAYFGPRPVTARLKSGLVDRIDRLLE